MVSHRIMGSLDTFRRTVRRFVARFRAGLSEQVGVPFSTNTFASASPGRWLVVGVTLLWWASIPVAAQEGAGSELCGTALATFLDNLLTMLAGAGPLAGAVFATYAMVRLTHTRKPEDRREWLERRNDAIKYGIGSMLIGSVILILVNLTGMELADCISVLP